MALPQATLELLLDGKPATVVTEGQPVSLMVNALKRVAGARLWLGELELRPVPEIPANTSVALELAFPDYIGENTLLLKDSSGRTLSNTLEVFVKPALMEYELFEELRDEHLPQLIQGAGAEDTAAQTYPGATPTIEEETINFNIAQLLEFSKALLGTTRKILELLSYHIQTDRRHLKGHLRGTIRWQKTAVARAQKGLDYATVHVADIRRRKWNTPTNLLLVRFHMEVFMEALFFRDEIDRREREKKAWAAIYATTYAGLDPEMAERMETLEAVLMVHKQVLSNPKLKPLILEAKEERKESLVFRRKAPEEARRVKNRSYRDLIDLWQRYLAEYESYYEDTVQIRTRRMRDLYALWVATEIANALKLRASLKSLRQFHSAKRDIILRYDAPEQVRQGWSDSILAMLFDDGEGTDRTDEKYKKPGTGGPELFLHYKGLEIYLEARYDLRQRPRPSDVYKVLAFMSNYNAPCGLIFYPGPKLKLSYNRDQGQVMAWIPFGPKTKIYDIAPDYLAFALENVADLYRFMSEGKPVAKLAELIEAAAAEFYATGGATELPETERWQPPPEEDIGVRGEPEIPPGAPPATETPLPAPEGPSPAVEGPFGSTSTEQAEAAVAGAEGEPPEEMREPPTPEEALEMEAEAHEAQQAAALEEALEEGLPVTAAAEGEGEMSEAAPPEVLPEARKLDYAIRKRKRREDQEAKARAKPAPPAASAEGPRPAADAAPARPPTAATAPSTGATPRRPAPSRGARPPQGQHPPATRAAPGPRPKGLTWTPAHTSKQTYEPVSEAGEDLHLSLEKLRDIVHKAEDKLLEETTEWVAEEEAGDASAKAADTPTAPPPSPAAAAHPPPSPPAASAPTPSAAAAPSAAASTTTAASALAAAVAEDRRPGPSPSPPSNELKPSAELKPSDEPPSTDPPPPHFADPRDLPELPEGSDWVGRQERRRWEGGGLEEKEKEVGKEGTGRQGEARHGNEKDETKAEARKGEPAEGEGAEAGKGEADDERKGKAAEEGHDRWRRPRK